MAVDVLVVGGGVIGCACALELAEAGCDVVVLERAELGAGASGRNQGLLLPSPAPAYAALLRESVARYRRLDADGDLAFGLRPVDHLLLAGDEPTLAGAAEQAAALAAGGFDVEALGPGELVAAEPCLAPDLAGGFRLGDAWSLDPLGATLAWAAAARRAGAAVRTHAAARRLVAAHGRVTGVLTDDGEVSAGAVLLAAGPWSRALALPAGVHLPVGGARGWLLQTAPLPFATAHTLQEATWPGPAGAGAQARPPSLAAMAAEPAEATDEGTAFTLHRSRTGHATIGASLAVSLREDPECPETTRGLARRALRFVPALAGVEVLATWSGVRPVTADGYPLIGPAPGTEGLWIAAGHGAEGVMLAPSTARILARHLLDGRAEADAAPFATDRFAGTDRRAGTDHHAGADRSAGGS